MYSFEVKGGKKLKGEVDISGSKNASLPILATAILNEKPVTFTNVPNIEDVNTTLKILNYLGCKVTRNCGKITISSKNINKYEIPKSLMQKCRSTVILVGALIARFHKAVFYFPGGCNIGKRPIDLHMKAFEKLGIEYKEYDGLLYPVLSVSEEAVKPIHIGKYGRMWIEFMKTEHPDRYRNLVRFGRLWDKTTEIDEEAYELLEAIESKWLSSHKPKNRQSFWEMYQLRTQARLMAEETVLHQVIRQYH